MALNLNASPYYDDFDGTKNYNRVLFKPGVAVQARELTQLQTALADQLGQLASYNLKEGGIISGCEEKITRIAYIKVTDVDFGGTAIENTSLVNYIGATLVGATTGLKAKVLTAKTGTTGATPDTKILYISYIDQAAGTNTNGLLEFGMGEKLTVESDNSSLNGDTFVTYNSSSAAIGDRARYSGFTSYITLSPGIIYARGSFIRTTEISTFIDPITLLADRKIGFVVTEKVVASTDDNTLLDPANGSFNYNAPGADRLNFVVSLKSFNNTETLPDNFYQYATWQFGQIIRSRIKTDQLGKIGNIIADRAYNANGNYVLEGLQTYFREHLDDGKNNGQLPTGQGGLSTKLIAAIRPGKANVAGYPIELFAEKLIPFNKPSATRIEDTVTQSTSFGNYVLVDDVCGAWDVDGGDGAVGNGIVDLYDTVQNGVSGTNFSATSIAGAKVGTAKTRHISLHSGTVGAAAAVYKLYLYDIRMSVGDFTAVRGISYQSTAATGFADIVLVGGKAQVYDSNFNKLIWTLPYSHIKTLQANSSAYDYNFKFTKEYDLSADTAGVINVAAGITNQTFFFGNGVVSNAVTEANMTLVAREQFVVDSTTFKKGEIIPIAGKVTQNSETSLVIDLGTSASGTRDVRLFVNTQVANTAPIAKALLENRLVKIDATTNANSASGKYSLGISDIFNVKQILATDNADYVTGVRDVTRDFIVDNGQRDNSYNLGSIQKRISSTLNTGTYRYITVKLDYFSRTVSGPTFTCVDSYPIDDTGSTGIKTEEIPLYSSPTGGVFDLKNSIDFRPYIANTAANSTTIGGATVNPAIIETIDRPSNGLTNPVPVLSFTTDLEYYLAEAYRVVITAEGIIRVLKSIPEINPKTPEAPPKAMTLARGFLPPYPCLAKSAAKTYGRQDLALSIRLEKNKRYTMSDIGGLEERISNLEYYTTLTLLEKQAGEVKILNASGVDRFKNGFMVDSFTGFGINNVTHQDNKCSIDIKNRELRAAFDTTIIGFKADASGTTAGQTGDMFHVPFFESVYTSQLQASKHRNVVSELLFSDPSTPDVAPTAVATVPVAVSPPPVPVAAGQPSYALVRSKTAVNEGSSFTITLETDNVASGTLVPYTITGVTTADIGGVSLTGNFTVDSAGDAFATFAATVDADSAAETFTLALNNGLVSTAVTINATAVTSAATPIAPGSYNGSLTLTPSQDSWYDFNSSPEPYENINGEYDHLNQGSLLAADGTTSGWKLQWGAWEQVASTVGGNPPDFGQGTFSTEAEYGVNWITEGAIPANSTSIWEKRVPYYVAEDTSVVHHALTDTFMQPVSISGSVEGLLPNSEHMITMDGVRKGSLTSNANGRGSFTISANTGEFRTGDLVIQVSNAESITSTTSFAQAIFTANHTKNIRINFPGSTRSAMPSDPILPEVRHIETTTTDSATLTSVQTAANVEKSTLATSDTSVRHEVVTTTGEVIATGVTASELNKQDIEVSVSQANGVTTTLMKRFDGTEYTIDYDDRDSFIFDQAKAINNKVVIAEEGTTYNSGTKTTTTVQASVDSVIIEDISNNIDSNTGGVHVTTATHFRDELDDTEIASALNSRNFVGNVSLTKSNNASTNDVATIKTSFTNTVNDATTDSTLAAVAAEALQFDFSDFDLFCLDYGLYGEPSDPTAQTFFVENMPGGMYITSADIFFRSISAEENNNGIKLQIRNMVNGVPGTTIIPNGEVHMRRSHCYTSTINGDGTINYASTNFKFKNPVHLENNTEYCMVLIPDADDPGYEVYVAELGGTELGKTSRVSKQAHTGVLFTSANNRSWSAHQSEDLMFVLRRAKFDVNTNFVLNTTNKNTDWIKVDHTTWDTTLTNGKIPTPKFTKADAIHGFKFTIGTAGAGYSSAPTIAFSGGGGTGATATATESGGAVTAITLTNPGSGYTSAPTITLSGGGSPSTDAVITAVLNRAIHKFFDRGNSTYELEVTDGYFTVGDMIGNGTTYVDIASINNRAISAHVIKAATVNPDNRGTITPKIAFTKTGATSANTTYSNVRIQSTEELDEEKTIYSYSNEQVSPFNGSKTGRLQFTLSTTSNNVGPMVDLAGLDMLALVNKINSPVVAEEVAVGGNADSKYISRQVILAEGQDAEDLKVYLDNKIPAGTAVEVYAKVLHAADDADFLNEISWKKLGADETPFVGTEAFAEYSYKIPAKASGWGVNGSGILEYDVSRISAVAITSGGAGYSSAPTVTLTDAVALTGTLTAATNTTAVTGSGTAFETELEVGSVLLDSTGAVAGTVSSISSDTALTLTINSLVAITGASAKLQGNGFGATAEAVLNASNVVTAIRILNPGRGYTGTVTATVSGGSPSSAAVLGAVTKSTVTYTGFKYFAVKIVHLSPDTAVIPKSSGLRAYALQV